MSELSGIDASILALIANNAPLSSEQVRPLLEKLSDPTAKKVAEILASEKKLPANAESDIARLVKHLRNWALRNRLVHAAPARAGR